MAGPTQGRGAQLASAVSAEEAQAKAIASVATAELDAKLAQVKAQAERERAEIALRQARVEAQASPLTQRAKAMEKQEQAAAKSEMSRSMLKPMSLPEVRPLNLRNPSAPVIQGGASFAPGPEGAVGGAAAQQALQSMQGGNSPVQGPSVGGTPSSVNIAGQDFAVPSHILTGRVQSETGNQQITPWYRAPQTTTRTSMDLEPNVLKAFEAARLLQEQQESNRRQDLAAQVAASNMIRDFGDTFHSKDWGAAFSLARAQASGDVQGIEAALSRMGKTLPEQRNEAVIAAQRANIAESMAGIRASDAATNRSNLGTLVELETLRQLQEGATPTPGSINLFDQLYPHLRDTTQRNPRTGVVKVIPNPNVPSYPKASEMYAKAFDAKTGKLKPGAAPQAVAALPGIVKGGYIPVYSEGGWGSSGTPSVRSLQEAFSLFDQALAGSDRKAQTAAREELTRLGLVSEDSWASGAPQAVADDHPNYVASDFFIGSYHLYNELRRQNGGGLTQAPPSAPAEQTAPSFEGVQSGKSSVDPNVGGNLSGLRGKPKPTPMDLVRDVQGRIDAQNEEARRLLDPLMRR